MDQRKLLPDEVLGRVDAPAPARAPAEADARLLQADRRQGRMRVETLEELLPTDHRARLFWAATAKLDLSKFYEPIQARGSEPGRPAVDPRILLTLWLYATSTNV